MSVVKFELIHPEQLPDQKLKDVEIDLLSATATFEPTIPSIAGIGFKMSASANGKIEAYNEPSDSDKDEVLGKTVEDEDAFGKIVLPPQIEISDQSAWLKYRFEASASVSAEAKVAPIGFKIDASKKIIFADYRIHGRDENTILAATADVTKLRFAGDPDDALKLNANEALYYEVRGEFSTSVTLNWSDVFTAGLSQLASTLPVNQLLMFEISPSASVEFHVGVVDDFQLVLTKGTNSRVRVALKKSKSNELGVSASLQVVAKFADEAKVKEFLDKAYEATIGQSLNKLSQILNAPANQLNKLVSDLPSPLKDIAQAIITRLNLGDIDQPLKNIKDRIEAIQKKIQDTLAAVAKAKVELGFKYEYLRVSTNDTLFVVQLDEATFRKYHKDLMLCDYINLLEWAKANESAVERYLNQKTLARTQSWGFTLGFLKWNLGGKDKKELISVVQEDIRGRKRIAYRGMRGYEASFGGKFGWAVDFNAEMEGFSANPTACDFEYGLHIRRSWEEKMSADNLREFFDDALIWQVMTLSNLNEAIEAIRSSGNLNKKAKVSVELTFKDKTLRKLLSAVSVNSDNSIGAIALANAMPYNKMFPTRADRLKDRQAAYAPLWKFYLENSNLDVGNYANAASNFISNLHDLEDEQGLALREKQNVFFDTFSQQIEKNGTLSGSDLSGIQRNWNEFTEGLKTLNKSITPGQCASHKTIEEVFNSLRSFWSQSLFVRATGVYLTRLAANNNVNVLGEVNKVCTVTFADKTVFTFGKSV